MWSIRARVSDKGKLCRERTRERPMPTILNDAAGKRPWARLPVGVHLCNQSHQWNAVVKLRAWPADIPAPCREGHASSRQQLDCIPSGEGHFTRAGVWSVRPPATRGRLNGQRLVHGSTHT